MHLSGTGIGDLGDVLVLPITGKLQESTNYQALTVDRLRSGFSHDNEFATPGYYRVMLDKYHVLAELTATAHAGMHRYTFPASKESHILIDLVHGVNNQVTEASLRIENNKMLTGQRTTTGQKILLRVGLSAVSAEEAKKNLQAEIPSWDFDAVRTAARNTWNEQLSSIKIESANPNIRQTFYSALYHTMTTPTLYNDADASYRGPDGQVHTNASFQYYSTFSLWDTYRAEHPLLTLVQPRRINDFVLSLLTFYEQDPNKRLPMWALASYDTGTMIGYHTCKSRTSIGSLRLTIVTIGTI